MGTMLKAVVGGTTHLIGSTLYGTCATAAATAAKVVTCSNFDTLVAGTTIHVKFTYSNTVASPTLNVNSTGAKPIYRYGTTTPGTSATQSWYAGAVVSFTYETDTVSTGCWQMNDYKYDTNTTYSAGTGISLSGTTFSNSGVRSVSTGTSNGTISVNTNGTSANVSVYGLGAAAYLGTTQSKTDTWGNGVVIVGSDGVSEVGKYIDFHSTDGNTADYDARITASTTGLTLSGTTSGTFSGSLSGNASSATKLATARTIWGESFNGTANISGNMTGVGTINAVAKPVSESVTSNTTDDAQAGTRSGLLIYGTTYGNDSTYLASSGKLSYGDPGPQIIFNTANSQTSGQIAALIYTDHDTIASGNSLSLVSNQSDCYFIAPHIKALTGFVGSLSGNATTATTLATARTINGTSFNGSANITTTNWGTARSVYIADSDGTNTGAAVSVNGGSNPTLKLPATIKATLSGNASTASSAAKLTTARTITLAGDTSGSVSFDGSANVTLTETNNSLAYRGTHTEVASYSSSYTTTSAASGGMLDTSQGMYLTGTYNDSNTPASYGNIINVLGSGSGQLLLGWSGTDNTTEKIYYRSHRDTSTGGWGPWKTIAYTDSTVSNATNATTATKLGSSTVGGTYQPVYLNSGTATTGTSYAGAIKSITRSGTTFTYTTIDGSTGTFTQQDNNTTYSAGTGLSLSGTTFNHASSVTAGTAGTSSATSGATLAVPYVTYNATGHITATGTHTHTISGLNTSAITAGTLPVARGGTGQTSLSNVSVGSATTATTLQNVSIGGNNTNNYPYHRILSVSGISTAYSDTSGIFTIAQNYDGGNFGIFKVTMRTNSSGSAVSVTIKWLVREGWAEDAIQFGRYGVSVTNSCYADIFLKTPGTYPRTTMTRLHGTGWTMVTSTEASSTTTSDRGSSKECYSSISDAATQLHSGTAYTATGVATQAGVVQKLDSGSVSTASVGSASSWSAGSVPTLGTAIAADDITAWSAGSVPTLGTAIAADDITAWSAGTASSTSYSAGVLTITNSTVPSLSYTARSIPNVTSVGTAPSLTYTARSIPNVTAVGTAPSLTITSTSVVKSITTA